MGVGPSLPGSSLLAASLLAIIFASLVNLAGVVVTAAMGATPFTLLVAKNYLGLRPAYDSVRLSVEPSIVVVFGFRFGPSP